MGRDFVFVALRIGFGARVALTRILLPLLIYGTGLVLSQGAGIFFPLEDGRLWQRSEDALRRREPAKALKLLDRLIESNPDNPLYIGRQAQALLDFGDLKRGAQAMERYLELSPFPEGACPSLGRVYAAMGDPARALRAHERCVDLLPREPAVLFEYAQSLEMGGSLAKAEAVYARAGAVDPDKLGPLLARARILLKQERPREAEKMLGRILQRAPGNKWALQLGVVAAEKMGDGALARRRREALLRDDER